MNIVEIVVSFACGLLVILLLGFVFSLKTKGLFRIAVNTIVGGILLVVISLTGIVTMPLNPFNALIVGVLGVPGLIALVLLCFLL